MTRPRGRPPAVDVRRAHERVPHADRLARLLRGRARRRHPRRPTICLSMIVRDEAHVMEETLASVAPRIDTWVIVDTGSIDATQEVVKRFCVSRGIPGEFHERPWVDFGTNRTEALALCRGKADYAWVIDALSSERDAGARRVTLRTRGPVAAP